MTLERARAGDDEAFRRLTEPYRRELLVHCYRLLGSLTDAEDLLQETMLAAWRGLAGYQQRASMRTWLYRIATNQCLNAMRAANRRIPTEPSPPFVPPEPTRRSEITWLQPYPDSLLEGLPDQAPGPEARYQATEAVELAFVAGLQRMPPRQAAALVLGDVLGFGLDEIAGMLGTSATAVKGTLQRARAALGTGTVRERGGADRDAARAVSRRFADAFVAADLDAIIALLTDDAWLSMPPAPHEYHGLGAVAEFLRTSFAYRGGRHVMLLPAGANTQPAFGAYVDGQPAGLMVLTVEGGKIRAINRFHVDALFPLFGLPETGTDRG
jgi:RNA polymerase sigma-70 factor (ECF subfamily)